jgi:hypothetical protein
MKKIHFIIAFVCFCFAVNAQLNLVPNNSFEIADTCLRPGGSPSYYAKYWFDVRNTPDFFSTCDTSGGIFSVPLNAFGYQCAANGNNYLGLLMIYPATLNPGSQEVAGCKLTDSLIKNTKYHFSYKINLSGGTGVAYAVKKFGFKLTTKKIPLIFPNTTSNDYIVNNSATFSSTVYLTDTLNWMNIKGSFIADSNYKYFNIGGFYDYANIDTIKTLSQPGQSSYYYLDDICISTDSNTCKINTQPNCIFTNIKTNSSKLEFSVNPNPCNEYFYIKGIKHSAHWKLINIEGDVIRSGNISENEYFKINDLPESVYVLHLYTDQGVLRKKIIVKH